ncbi:MAG: hypothetical protein ACK6D4_06710, partial [Planctomyces sp.]
MTASLMQIRFTTTTWLAGWICVLTLPSMVLAQQAAALNPPDSFCQPTRVPDSKDLTWSEDPATTQTD